MKLLLDTHVFLWFISGDNRLTVAVSDAIRDPANEIFLSVVSLWEAIIKYQIGKLHQSQPPEITLPLARARHLISSLPLDEESVAHVAMLPLLHRDPYDLLLIAQAQHHILTLVTVDDAIRLYPGLSVM